MQSEPFQDCMGQKRASGGTTKASKGKNSQPNLKECTVSTLAQEKLTKDYGFHSGSSSFKT